MQKPESAEDRVGLSCNPAAVGYYGIPGIGSRTILS